MNFMLPRLCGASLTSTFTDSRRREHLALDLAGSCTLQQKGYEQASGHQGRKMYHRHGEPSRQHRVARLCRQRPRIP